MAGLAAEMERKDGLLVDLHQALQFAQSGMPVLWAGNCSNPAFRLLPASQSSAIAVITLVRVMIQS